MASSRPLARLRRALEARPWIRFATNGAAALLFLLGCLGFYHPSLYVHAVTLFLLGSLLWLLSTVADALMHYRAEE